MEKLRAMSLLILVGIILTSESCQRSTVSDKDQSQYNQVIFVDYDMQKTVWVGRSDILRTDNIGRKICIKIMSDSIKKISYH